MTLFADRIIRENSLSDDELFSRIYSEYVRTLYQYGCRLCRDEELVKDAIQELFTTLYLKRNEINISSNLRSYLFVSFKNILYTLVIKENHYTSIEEEEMDINFTLTVEDEYLEKETEMNQKEKIKEILHLLPSRQQEIIYLRYIKGLSIEEISALLSINYQSVQNNLQRSFKKLKTRFHTGILFPFILYISGL